jgi:3-carboxy-cis,cis-muconate cycloisomerase
MATGPEMPALPDFDPGFSTARMTATWSAAARVKRMLEVEAALIEAAADAGLVPRAAVVSIQAACDEGVADPAALLAEGWKAGTPVVALLEVLRARVGADVKPYLQIGATSQDIIDTATVLMLRASFAAHCDTLGVLADALHGLMTRHSDAWVMARTLLQPALPFRFSVRVARWLDPVLDRAEEALAASGALPIQLGGPVGDLGSFGAGGEVVARRFAEILHLSVPRLAWHTDRTVVVRAVNFATGVAAASASIAADLALLAQPEIGEIRMAAGVSSSIPHKRNPHHAVRSLAAARACQGAATIVTAAHPHELERAAGSWQAEWFAVPLVMQTAAAALEAAVDAVTTATLDAERARANVGQAPQNDAASADRLVERVASRYRQFRGRAAP